MHREGINYETYKRNNYVFIITSAVGKQRTLDLHYIKFAKGQYNKAAWREFS